MSHMWWHLFHSAHREDEQGRGKAAGVMYVILGLITAPMLIGIPVLLFGFYKLLR